MAKTQYIKGSRLELLCSKVTDIEGLEDLKPQDYSALIAALQKKGELSLLHGDDSGLTLFDMALELDPANWNLLFQQGLALFEYGSEEGKEKELTLASRRFKQTVALNPECFEAYHAWGNTLYFLGIRKNEPSYFLNARKKYEKALSLSAGMHHDVLADLYWDFGDLWRKLAEISGEATELHLALKAYENATSLQDDFSSEFWLNFGDVYLKLGQKTNDLRLHVKAVNSYKNAISISISSHEGWLRLGFVLKEIYSYTHDEDHFSQANECYSAAAQLGPSDETLWVEWAKLLVESGQYFRDSKKLRSCIEKCQKGHGYHPKSTHLLSIWAEALSALGSLNEKLELLHEAENKITELANKVTDDPEIFYAYGMCLFAIASYFNDADYYYQAIEKFQEGLSLNRAHHRLWFGMGAAHIEAAAIDGDEKNYERACRFFERALNLKASSIYHFYYGSCLLKYAELLQDQATAELSIHHFEQAIGMQKNVAYLHPEWLFEYASALDFLGEFSDNDAPYAKAIDILNHILMMNPEFPNIHRQLALTYGHYGELINEPEIYHRSFHHFRIAHQRDKENDQIILDWAVTLVNLSELLENQTESDQYLREAEYKMIQAAKLGNTQAYFSLACLYSLQGDYARSLSFLEKAFAFDSLPPLEEVIEDEWLEGVRETAAFQSFIENAESQLNELD